jgi:hypothetical protein
MSRRALGALVTPDRRAEVAGRYDRAVVSRRIDRAEEADLHIVYGVAYAVLAYGGEIAGLEAARRWLDAIEKLDSFEIVAVILDEVR